MILFYIGFYRLSGKCLPEQSQFKRLSFFKTQSEMRNKSLMRLCLPVYASFALCQVLKIFHARWLLTAELKVKSLHNSIENLNNAVLGLRMIFLFARFNKLLKVYLRLMLSLCCKFKPSLINIVKVLTSPTEVTTFQLHCFIGCCFVNQLFRFYSVSFRIYPTRSLLT
ncbi:CLUMA_CG017602, isoform A [Clunio marinus]|uniref:CLUMA_CG017602, isoform A n=1 Tax=Clunio marinus TaxID=568069 RepID=A0A1J1IWJ1_9DIPT|nr:CLUMA_CG017602, isoform A [Clunio marinus]